MLSFALKAVWFALCALGTIATWPVLWFLGKAINTYWLPILYCIGLTILEGIFCLGMIYHMDPFKMPRSFCLAQIFTISFSALLLTGVCLTIILAVATKVIVPSPQPTLRWKWGYLVPLFVIPVTFASLQLALDPIFGLSFSSLFMIIPLPVSYARLALLGYAGTPAFESLPCFAINIAAVFRVRNMYKSDEHTGAESKPSSPESRKQDAGQSQTHSPTTIELRPASSLYSRSSLDLDPEAPTLTPPSRAVMSQHSSVFAKVGRVPPTPQFRSAVSPPSPSLRHSFSSSSGSPLRYNSQSRSPGWGPGSSQAGSLSPWSGAESFELQQKSGMDVMDDTSVMDSYDSTTALTQEEEEEEEEEDMAGDDVDIHREPMAVNWDELSQPQALPDARASFMSLIWRLNFFFLFFSIVQILISLSTIIDVSRGRHALTPFGTQHVALLFAAWAPTVIFAHAPGVRVRLAGFLWRSR